MKKMKTESPRTTYIVRMTQGKKGLRTERIQNSQMDYSCTVFRDSDYSALSFAVLSIRGHLLFLLFKVTKC